MATTPTLRTRMNTEAQANNAVLGWSQAEAAVEILHEDLQALEVPTPPTGTDATQVQGTATDNAVAVGKPVQVGGVAVDASSYIPAYTVGDAVKAAFDYISGGLLCHTRKLTRADDIVSADPKQYSTVSTATPATADATVFTLAAGEKGFIQNLSADAPLAYKLGASASTSSFNGVLNCGSAVDDGKGGNVIVDDFIGVVSVAKISGTARYIAFKMS
jgi:hypothetical protein